MKAFTLALGILAIISLATARSGMDMEDNRLVTMDLKERQMFILKLLNQVTEPVMYKEIEDMGRNFSFEENTDLFMKTDVVKCFVNNIKMGMLPRGEIFTIHVDRQLKEVVTMFHMLYFAKDFTTFIKTACWMRMYCNEGMFVYALTVACRHREDCNGIILPPPYEIYPYFFVRTDVIQKAYMLKMKKGMVNNKLADFYGIRKTEKDVYIIDENKYDSRVVLNDEDKLRYFTEDIDLNTYYFYFHVDYPFWMKSDMMRKTFRNRRYEMTLYMYQQILARHYLERLCNDMGEVPTLSWEKRLRKGYWPWMMHHNGVEMPVRMNDVNIVDEGDINTVRLVESYETIISEAITKGFIEINGKRLEMTKPEDIENLGMLIYGKIDKEIMEKDRTRIDAYRYLVLMMKAVIGLNTVNSDKYFVAPSVLDSYQTALRDPAFYMLQKRIVKFLMLFKKHLPCYTNEELYFPGVKIDNVVVDKLVTYFDDYLMDMTNAVFLNDEELKKRTTDMKFLVRKRRLNHQPFKITMDVVSDKATDCIVRIFLGPKTDHMGRMIDINRNRWNFVELDTFLYKLTSGKNTIMRNSMDMHNLVRDRMMTRDMWKKVETVTDMKDMINKDMKNWHTGFPTRLLLPKGRVGGMKMMMYVIVTPLRMIDTMDMNIDLLDNCQHCDFRSTTLMDKMPLGFPLDRHIDVTKFFTPNMKFTDVMIFHKKVTCDMKTRWERYVLKDYNMIDRNSMTMDMNMNMDFTNVDLTMKNRDTNTFDL